MKAISKAQAHMLAVTRMLGRVHHNSGFKGGIRTARALAAKGLLDLDERGDGSGIWFACIPVATLMNEAGMTWVQGPDDKPQFIRMGDTWTAPFDGAANIVARYYSVRTWHDGRRYFLVKHPFTEESKVAFLDDLEIRESNSK